MVLHTTKLLILGLSLKIQYFSRAFRMSWSCFLTLSITVNLRFCTPQFLKCLTEGMFFVSPLISLRFFTCDLVTSQHVNRRHEPEPCMPSMQAVYTSKAPDEDRDGRNVERTKPTQPYRSRPPDHHISTPTQAISRVHDRFSDPPSSNRALQVFLSIKKFFRSCSVLVPT